MKTCIDILLAETNSTVMKLLHGFRFNILMLLGVFTAVLVRERSPFSLVTCCHVLTDNRVGHCVCHFLTQSTKLLAFSRLKTKCQVACWVFICDVGERQGGEKMFKNKFNVFYK